MSSAEPYAVGAVVLVYFFLGMLPTGWAFIARMIWLLLTGIASTILFRGKGKIAPALWGTFGLIELARLTYAAAQGRP